GVENGHSSMADGPEHRVSEIPQIVIESGITRPTVSTTRRTTARALASAGGMGVGGITGSMARGRVARPRAVSAASATLGQGRGARVGRGAAQPAATAATNVPSKSLWITATYGLSREGHEEG